MDVLTDFSFLLWMTTIPTKWPQKKKKKKKKKIQLEGGEGFLTIKLLTSIPRWENQIMTQDYLTRLLKLKP
jgi:hypothetical protein